MRKNKLTNQEALVLLDQLVVANHGGDYLTDEEFNAINSVIKYAEDALKDAGDELVEDDAEYTDEGYLPKADE